MVKVRKAIYKCHCLDCIAQPDSDTALFHRSINRLVATLNEKDRRQFVGLLASQLGHGGITTLAKITGLHRKTIERGRNEIRENDIGSDARIRVAGGGRHKVEKKRPIY